MRYHTEAPKGFLIVGQGDNVVEEWLEPFSDLEEIDNVIANACQYDIDIPWENCTAQTRIFRKLVSSEKRIESAVDLIGDHPAIELNWKSYGEDDDMPGRSGSFLMVLVRKTKAKSFLMQVSKLKESLLDFWEISGGLDRELDNL